jgi:hypothetical protein
MERPDLKQALGRLLGPRSRDASSPRRPRSSASAKAAYVLRSV